MLFWNSIYSSNIMSQQYRLKFEVLGMRYTRILFVSRPNTYVYY